MPSRKSRLRAPIQVLASVVAARATAGARTMAEVTIGWFAGVDWGSQQHQVCVLDAAGKVVGKRAFPHGGAGLAALCGWLVSMADDPGSVAVAIEVPHGPVVDALLDRGFAVHAINPKQLDRLRDRFSVAGAKDDRRDARVAAAGLCTDRHLFRPVAASDPAVIELREWARLREATIAKLLRQHRIRRIDAETALGILRQPAIKVAAGVTEAAVLHLQSLVARLRLANREFHQAEHKLDALCTALSETASATEDSGPGDVAILSSLPGVGKVTLATLLTEAAGPLTLRDYAALRTLSGVAPVTKRSGKTCLVVMRYAAQVRLRNAVFHWARVAVLNDPTCRRRYAALRARGHSYGRALRGVADRLLGVACVLLQRRVLFAADHGKRAASQPRAAS